MPPRRSRTRSPERPTSCSTDVRMAGMDGLALLRELRRRRPQAVVVLMTAYATVAQAVDAMRAGAYDYLVKPFSLDQVGLLLDPRARGAGAAAGERRACAGRSSSPALLESAEPRHAARARDGPAGGARRTPPCCSPARAAPARTCWPAAMHRWSPRARRPVRHHRLHDARGAPARERALRPRARRLHRRLEGQAGPARGGATAARCSSTRSASCPRDLQAQAPALPRGAPLRARRRRRDAHGRRAHHRRDQPRPGGRGRGRPLPRGPLLPPERRRASACPPCASAARTSPALVAHISARLCARHGRARLALAAEPARAALAAYAGPATCASWSTRSSAPSCWRAATRSRRGSARPPRSRRRIDVPPPPRRIIARGPGAPPHAARARRVATLEEAAARLGINPRRCGASASATASTDPQNSVRAATTEFPLVAQLGI